MKTRIMKRLAKYAVGIYVAQALAGVSVGVYLALTMTPAEVERILTCVTH